MYPLIGQELERMRVEMLRAEAQKRRRATEPRRRRFRWSTPSPDEASVVRSVGSRPATTMRRMIEITARARDALRTSAAAATRFDPQARIRLTTDASGVRADLVHAAEPGDDELTLEDVSVLVDPSLEGTIDTGDHNAFVLVPR